MEDQMRLSRYDYHLPADRIAKYPTENRDDSRLMVVHRRTGKIEHRVFKDILEYFHEKDCFIFNNTKVFPARLYGNKEKSESDIELFLLRELNAELRLWDALVEPARKIRIGNKVYFGDNDEIVGEIIDNTTSRGRTIRFLYDGSYEEYRDKLRQLGEVPLPRWIREKVEPLDEERYQTIFAEVEGAVVAPSSNLHFSKHLMKRMEIKGIEQAFVTLHVGLGYYQTIDVEDLTKHKMGSEQMVISEEQAEKINRSKRAGKKIIAVGTTVQRAIETSIATDGCVVPYEGWTNKFIFGPYNFGAANAMVTNFHRPSSTQIMMVASFAGYDLMMKAYKTAIDEGYRFGAYGDAMLII